MIVCGKCGFTQPKDVYCANCGVNLEKYKPEKPPKLVQLLKDPYFQISFSIIVAIAAFFIFINKPAPTLVDEATDTPEVELIDSKAETLPNSKDSASSDKQIEKAKAPTKTKTKGPSFKKQLKALVKGKTKSLKEVAATTAQAQAAASDSEASTIEEPPPVNIIKKATFNFYEILPGQVDKYFTGSAKVEASVIKKEDLDIQNLSNDKLIANSKANIIRFKVIFLSFWLM